MPSVPVHGGRRRAKSECQGAVPFSLALAAWPNLSRQHEPERLRGPRRLEAAQVEPGVHRTSSVVGAVPADALRSPPREAVEQRGDAAAAGIEDLDFGPPTRA